MHIGIAYPYVDLPTNKPKYLTYAKPVICTTPLHIVHVNLYLKHQKWMRVLSNLQHIELLLGRTY